MSSELAIEARGLEKCYHIYERPSHRLLQGLVGRSRRLYREFWALRGLDLAVGRGETLGIIGRNGSGKSTLLQLIAGTLTPTGGSVAVDGRVAALLELGSGFNPEFTGRENVYLNASILGLSKAAIDQRLEAILAFADIGDFIDQPIRNYSSGMVMRLAFSVMVHVDADVLIIDEALAVGDAFFTQKCMRFLHEFRQRGTLLFVSHDPVAVTSLCDRAVWLDKGSCKAIGSARDVCEAYLAEQHMAASGETVTGVGSGRVTESPSVMRGKMVAQVDDGPDPRASQLESGRYRIVEIEPDDAGLSFGAGGAVIESVKLTGEDGEALKLVDGRRRVALEIRVRLKRDLEDVIIGFYLKNRLGQRLFGDNTYLHRADAPVSGKEGDVLAARFEFRMPIMPSGSYMIDAAVATGAQDSHVQQHWLHDALEILALDETLRYGLIGIPMLAVDVKREAS